MKVQGPVAIDKLEYFDIPSQSKKTSQGKGKCSVYKLKNHISNMCKPLPLCFSICPPLKFLLFPLPLLPGILGKEA